MVSIKKKFILALDLGGTKIATAVLNLQGEILSLKNEPTEVAGGPKVVIKQMIRMAEYVIKESKVKVSSLKGIGIGAAGPLNSKKGIIISPPNLPHWFNVQLKEPFEKHFSLLTLVDNDANCAALGEWSFGAGKGTRNMVYLTISTGIGGGIIIEKKLYQGTNDNAGEIGHMTIDPDGPLCNCGNYGCLEAFSSGTAIAKRAQEIIRKETPDTIVLNLANKKIENITAKIILQAAKAGDIFAKKIADDAFYHLGIGVANVINIFNPEKVVLGGGVTKSGNLLFDKVRKIAKQRAMKPLFSTVKIVPAKLGDLVGVMGAAALVL